MTYVDPATVDSPRANWRLIKVLKKGQADDASLAIGTWTEDGGDPKPVLAVRWNGRDNDEGVGHPQSRGLPTWFIIPRWMYAAILNSDVIPPDERALADALVNLGK